MFTAVGTDVGMYRGMPGNRDVEKSEIGFNGMEQDARR